MAIYSSSSQLEWREVEGGQLPSATVWSFGLEATLLDQTLYVSGGSTGSPDFDYSTSILSWDPIAGFGNQLAIWLLGEATMQPLPFQDQLLLCIANKRIELGSSNDTSHRDVFLGIHWQQG